MPRLDEYIIWIGELERNVSVCYNGIDRLMDGCFGMINSESFSLRRGEGVVFPNRADGDKKYRVITGSE